MPVSYRKKYKSRREKLSRNVRNIRVGALFVGIALIVYIIMNRVEIWSWLATFLL